METIVVASTNPVKVQAALNGFQAMFPDSQFCADGISVPSGVSVQPMTSHETLEGAANRATNAHQQRPDADYWVGIEGGVDVIDGQMEVFAWVVVQSRTRSGMSRTATFHLPAEVIKLVKQGVELGE